MPYVSARIYEETYNGWNIRSRNSTKLSIGWMAWASKQRLFSDSPITETAEPVYFEFGSTQEDTVRKLKRELDEVDNANG